MLDTHPVEGGGACQPGPQQPGAAAAIEAVVELMKCALQTVGTCPSCSRLVHVPACRKYGQRRFGGLVRSTLQGGQTAAQPRSPVSELTDKTELTREQFEALLGQIDKGLRALPATAQVGRGAHTGTFVLQVAAGLHLICFGTEGYAC